MNDLYKTCVFYGRKKTSRCDALKASYCKLDGDCSFYKSKEEWGFDENGRVIKKDTCPKQS